MPFDAGKSPLLSVEGVTLQYKTREALVTATWRVDVAAASGERVVLLGPSGCGKSTLLKSVGGFLPPAEGRIALGGREVAGPGPDRMMVIQEFDQLLPWKTVRGNIEFPLRQARRDWSRADIRNQAARYMEKVGLARFAESYPHQLSGGMKQRVAIARAFADGVLRGTLPDKAPVSLQVLLAGYGLGALLALLLAGLAASSRLGEDLLATLTAMFNPLPAIALLPLALLWFGLGTPSLLFVLVHAVVWPMALSASSGFASVAQTLRMAGRNYGLSGPRYVLLILVPAAFPAILAGLKVGWAFAWRTLIAAELVFGVASGSGGLGWFIFENKNRLETDAVFAGLGTVILIGLAVEGLVFRALERHTIRKWGMHS